MEINNKQFPIFNNKNFWLRWNALDNEQNPNSFTVEDDFHFNNLLILASTMTKLNLDINKIKEIIIDNVAPKLYNLKTDLGLKMLKDLHNCIEKEYKLYKNLR
jgi:hypothetical protein